jgi:hypothetical protein
MTEEMTFARGSRHKILMSPNGFLFIPEVFTFPGKCSNKNLGQNSYQTFHETGEEK